MSAKQDHPFHLVNPSPWPALAALALLLMPVGGVMMMHKHQAGIFPFLAGFSLVLYVMFVWWRDVVREGIHDHAHTNEVRHGLRTGMALFITSEVMFFFAFFFAYFSVSIWPVPSIADLWNVTHTTWPPKGTVTFDPFHLPFLNTLILLLSGTTVTWAHYALLQKDQESLKKALLITVLLGVSFSALQAVEYAHAPFGFKDGAFPSLFFMLTGFHGFHVIVGTIFLFVCYLRAKKGQFSEKHHLGFEFAAWYWHFVDVVWLFLFVFVYWWGGGNVHPGSH
jgi:cytochrome c oxidase subunit 3